RGLGSLAGSRTRRRARRSRGRPALGCRRRLGGRGLGATAAAGDQEGHGHDRDESLHLATPTGLSPAAGLGPGRTAPLAPGLPWAFSASSLGGMKRKAVAVNSASITTSSLRWRGLPNLSSLMLTMRFSLPTESKKTPISLKLPATF